MAHYTCRSFPVNVCCAVRKLNRHCATPFFSPPSSGNLGIAVVSTRSQDVSLRFGILHDFHLDSIGLYFSLFLTEIMSLQNAKLPQEILETVIDEAAGSKDSSEKEVQDTLRACCFVCYPFRNRVYRHLFSTLQLIQLPFSSPSKLLTRL